MSSKDKVDKKQNVYMHQFQTPSSKNFLPLAIGLVTAFQKTDSNISRSFNFELKILREDPIKTVGSYEDPAVLGFSAYSWNFQQSLEVAKFAKSRYPNVLIVFGGPMIGLSQKPQELERFFNSNPQVDIAVHGMGEWTFAEILRSYLDDNNFKNIPGISYRAADSSSGYVSSSPAIFQKPVNEIPSPFLEGIFDKILIDHGDKITGALWETNRGCPFKCAFCVQGDTVFNNVLVFDDDRLLDELKWLRENKFEYIFCTDANFGIRKRDINLAERIVKMKRDYQYPQHFVVNWVKNSSKKILDITEIFNKGGMSTRVTLSRQSFNEKTLEAVKRKNIKQKNYNETMHEANQRGILSYTELILGMPEETYDSFSAGIDAVMDEHFTHNFVVYLCRLLDGTEMASIVDREKYEYDTRIVTIGLGRNHGNKNGVDEYEELIVGTSTMSVSDWKKSHSLAFFALALYNYRLAFYVLNYCKNEYSINIREFFEFLIEETHDSKKYTVLSKAHSLIKECQENILQEQEALASLEFTGDLLFEPNEAATLICIKSLSDFYDELWSMVNEFLDHKGICTQKTLLREVFTYQMSLIPTWEHQSDSSVTFEYNIPQYFHSLCIDKSNPVPEIVKNKTTISVYDKLGFINNASEYAKKRITITTLSIAAARIESGD